MPDMQPKDDSGPERLLPAIGNQRGIALITVLIMILLLSILGATLLTSTTSEIRIASDYRNSDKAFFAADAGLEFAQCYGLIYSSISPTSTSWPGDSGLSSEEYPGYFKQQVTDDEAAVYVKVDYLATGPVPAGMGTEVDSGLGAGTGFLASFYAVSAIGEGPNDSRAEVEAQVIKIVPK